MVRVELAVPGQRVEQALDVGFEDAVDHSIVRLVQVLPQSVPEVKGNFYHLFEKKNPAFCYQQNIFSPLSVVLMEKQKPSLRCWQWWHHRSVLVLRRHTVVTRGPVPPEPLISLPVTQ